MSWIEHHEVSEGLASQAQTAQREGRREDALALYARAADAEDKALADLDASKTRTLGISAVSAVSLYYKAASFARAEKVATRCLALDSLPAFAREQLRVLLQSIWSEQVRGETGTQFAPGQVLVSVQGGEVVPGGAPLDLIVDKVKTVQSLFHRTAEFLAGLEHRRRGLPSKVIQESCRPWLFQTQPGSYQFAVAIQEEYQPDMFRPGLPPPRDVADCFLQILRVGIEDPEEHFTEVVPDSDYRSTFLKLTRNLAPQGKVCDRLEVRSVDGSRTITLDPDIRQSLGATIRDLKTTEEVSPSPPEPLNGILRAVHLDKDWLELAVDDKHLRVVDVGDQVDDVIGPMVNKPVIVHVSREHEKRRFLDIEPDD